MYNYLPTFFKMSYDGGQNSGVTGFWVIEWKPVFSLVFLKFNKGTREAYHNHAFSAITFWLWGEAIEHHLDGTIKKWYPSFLPKYTPKDCFHKIEAVKDTYAFSIRGPWDKTWQEYRDNNLMVTLTNGREIIEMESLVDIKKKDC
jgi:hypothetical protein